MMILVVAESEGGALKRHSAELIGKAASLVAPGGEVAAFVAGASGDALTRELGRAGADTVFAANASGNDARSGQALAQPLCAAVARFAPDCVLGSSTPFGADLLVRASMRLGVGMASDCTGISVEGEKVLFERPVYGGAAIAAVRLLSSPAFASVRPNSFSIPPAFDKLPAVSVVETVDAQGVRIERVEESEPGMVDLAEADRIVAAGRGIRNAENFGMIRELARALGATVGASRAAVDEGWISHDHQVGQSGRAVSPALYIACGISGSIQHMSGMRSSKVVVAINSDPEAPIFSRVDYGIAGDMFEVVPALEEFIREMRRK